MPARYVRADAKGQKNDFNDGEAIAEAVQRPTMKFVAVKTVDQLDLQALHRVRERLVSQRTGIINQIRAFLLERGVAVRQGIRFLRAELPNVLAARSDVLSPRMLRIIESLAGDWRSLDARIDELTEEIKTIASTDVDCRRTMSVPGIGPIISSATVAAIGKGDVFSKGRDFAAWLGIVPRHDSWQNLQTRQPLSEGPLRAGGLGGSRQTTDVGALRPLGLDRGGEEAHASQCSGDCVGEQARPHHLGGAGQGPQLRDDKEVQVQCCTPTCLSLASCSVLSRRGLQASQSWQGLERRPASTSPARDARRELHVGAGESLPIEQGKGTP